MDTDCGSSVESQSVEGVAVSAEKSHWIRLNVGGQIFLTTMDTLCVPEPHSMLARMFDESSKWANCTDETGAVLIDRDPVLFRICLNYLRNGEILLDKNVNPHSILKEAEYFGLSNMCKLLDPLLEDEESRSAWLSNSNQRISRMMLVSKIISTRGYCNEDRPNDVGQLRCQGLNFNGANLSFLDLSGVNFKYCSFVGANLSHCNLSMSNFERAVMVGAEFENSRLMGVNMNCANLENASMRYCNFEDDSLLHRANMEGANMKNVDLEASLLTGSNFRVACLKSSKLRNCNLRSAVLAAANLEGCDFSGSDLTEANFRGANMKDAIFADVINPVHMVQLTNASH